MFEDLILNWEEAYRVWMLEPGVPPGPDLRVIVSALESSVV